MRKDIWRTMYAILTHFSRSVKSDKHELMFKAFTSDDWSNYTEDCLTEETD